MAETLDDDTLTLDDDTLLLSLMCAGKVRWKPFIYDPSCGELYFGGIRHCTHLNSNGCPILYPALRRDLEQQFRQGEPI